MRPFVLLGSLILCCFAVRAQTPADEADAKPLAALEQRKLFKLPPGFEIQLVADESQIQKPMNLAFDAAGRLWVTGSELYPWPAKTDVNGQSIAAFSKEWDAAAQQFRVGDKAPQPSETGKDSVRVLSDFGPDGRARTVGIFAEKLNIPIGIQPLPRGSPSAERDDTKPKGDRAIVFSIPNIWLFTDVDGDGKADKNEVLYSGFGFKDTHGMSSNYLYWIDGWIYGCHGFSNHSEVRDGAGNVTVLESGNTYRFRPDGSKFEIYSHGQTNPFGLTVDPLGNFYTADSHSKPVYLIQRGGYYEGIGKGHDGLGFGPRLMEHDHGSSAIAGVAYYAAAHFPKEYWGNTFNGNPVTRRINRDRLEWHGATPKAIEMPDFLTCDDPWFRPVQVKLGPDGALWIADFYNPIIGHYEAPLTDPRRDTKHGRIWRIVWKGDAAPGSAGDSPAPLGDPPSGTRLKTTGKSSVDLAAVVPPVPSGGSPAGESPALPGIPNLTNLEVRGLIEALGDTNLIVRIQATHELAERIGERAVEPLKQTLARQDEAAALHAIWPLERLGGLGTREFAIAAQMGKDAVALLSRVQVERALRDPGRRRFADLAAVGENGRDLLESIQNSSDPTLARAAAEIFATGTTSVGIRHSLDLLASAVASRPLDTQTAYALRIALRDQLAAPGGYSIAAGELEKRDSHAGVIADISLAVPTSDSADYLLKHLQRTKLAAPRSGEFFKHAALHLPVDRLREISHFVQSLKDVPLARRLDLADHLARAIRQRGAGLPEELSAWCEGVMLEALDTRDEGLLRRALAAVRESQMKAKEKPLAAIVFDAKRGESVRVAALDAAANSAGAADLLARALIDPSSLALQKRSAELFGQRNNPADAEKLLAPLRDAPWELALAIASAAARNDRSLEMLLNAIESGKASAALLRNKTVAKEIGARAAALKQVVVSLTQDLPPEDARLDAAIVKRLQEFRSAVTDAAHGEQVFQQACAACHKVKDIGGVLAPNLDGVATRGVHRLIEDILDPNRNVDPAFAQVIIETKEGQTVAGIGVRAEGELLVLNDGAGQTVSVPKAQVKSQTQSRLSLMPADFETQLSSKDLSDLVAFLLGQSSTSPK